MAMHVVHVHCMAMLHVVCVCMNGYSNDTISLMCCVECILQAMSERICEIAAHKDTLNAQIRACESERQTIR